MLWSLQLCFHSKRVEDIPLLGQLLPDLVTGLVLHHLLHPGHLLLQPLLPGVQGRPHDLHINIRAAVILLFLGPRLGGEQNLLSVLFTAGSGKSFGKRVEFSKTKLHP